MVEKPAYEELEKKIKKLEKAIDKQKKAEKSLLHRAKLETLISDISTSFINIPSKTFDETINYSLQMLGEFADADRCYVFLIREDGSKLDNTHEWCRKGIESHIDNLQNLPVDIFPWWIKKLKNKESIIIHKMDDLPFEASAEKEMLQSQDIQSIVTVPMEYKDKLVGFLGFDFVKKKSYWKEEDTLLLRTIGNIFVSALKQKQAEDTLLEKENHLRIILKNLPGDVIVHDLEGRILLVNEEACRIKGYPEKDMLNMTVQELDPDSITRNDQGNVWEKLKPGRAVSFESVSVRKDGSQYVSEVHLSAAELEDKPVVIAVSFDITEQKRLQEIQEQRTDFERLINEVSSEFVGLSSDRIDAGIDRALASIGTFANADRAYVFLFQEDNEIVDNTHEWCADDVESNIENLKNRPFAKYHPLLAEHVYKNEILYVPDVANLPDEHRLERDHLEAHNVKSIIVVPMKLNDRLIGYLGLNSPKKQIWINDVQVVLRVVVEILSNAIERKRAEKEQEGLQKKLSDAMEIAHLGPYEYDFDKDIFIFNDHFYKIFRTTTEQMGGNTMPADEYFRRFVHPDDLPFLQDKYQEHLEAGNPNISRQHEHRIFYSDGTTGHISVWQFIEKDFQGNPTRTYGVIQDITERKLTEKKLRESEEKLTRSRKMESLGLLAGGVAHDLNNVLSGIVSYPELLLLDLPPDSKYRKPIKTIQESGNKAVAIVQDLLTIARGVASTKEPLNLNTVIENYLKSPEHIKLKQFYPAIRVITNLDAELLNISGSSIHLSKIIMNLVSNASEAIENSGYIRLTTSNRYLDMPLRGYEDVNTGEYAVLSVSDNGAGIPVDSLERIFEPFFTKKNIGRSGTGLGLAVVWNIVQEHDGYVDVKSDKEGTTFELYFPITRDEINAKNLPLPIEELKGNGETVLVVDDVESQREISCSILSVLDYKAVAVPCGEDAVEYLKENPVDLILLDMIMNPGINGRETYERIIKICPGQKALIVSGLAETDEVKKAQTLGAGEYIKKPLTLERIGLAIKKELAR